MVRIFQGFGRRLNQFNDFNDSNLIQTSKGFWGFGVLGQSGVGFEALQ